MLKRTILSAKQNNFFVMESQSDDQRIHILFFPFMALGHMLPTMDLARLFAARGVKTTIVTTPHNTPTFTKMLQNHAASASNIHLATIRFPSDEVGLPKGLENMNSVASEDEQRKFFRALPLFSRPLEILIRDLHPQALIADLFFPFANDVASNYGIPRLMFSGSSFFTICANHSLRRYKPQEHVTRDDEPFLLPGLPDKIEMVRSQFIGEPKSPAESDSVNWIRRSYEAVEASFGMIVNSFYELEPRYVDHYKEVLGKRAWHIGPVSLCNGGSKEKASRGGKEASIDERQCLEWLCMREAGSVVYVCFGSECKFSDKQLCEIAMGLEASEQNFIWVVRRDGKGDSGGDDDDNWLPQGFRKRTSGKGLIIKGWAPQVLILDHRSVGGMVTHCGWNSVLEGISPGLPMVTWPVFADQFYNEKLIMEVLRIGVGVGARRWAMLVGDFVRKEAVERAVREMMVGERADEMRSRARSLGEMAKRAVEEGGSSYDQLGAFIKDIRAYRSRP